VIVVPNSKVYEEPELDYGIQLINKQSSQDEYDDEAGYIRDVNS
jgi:hypothetical protein